MKIGLALSGGGTRGMVHLGAMQCLLDNGVEPDVVSGTSVGSIVGAFYVHGYQTSQIMEMATKGNIWKLFGLTLPTKGLARPNLLKKLLEKYIEDNSFSNVRKPFYIAITNLNTGRLEIKSEGPIRDYILASSAVPILFEPVEIEGNLYTDGGVLMNLPAQPIRDKCDLLIGINLIPRVSLPNERLKSVMDVGTRVFDLAALNNIKPQIELCDVLVEPTEISEFGRFSFNQFQKMFDIGYRATASQIPKIREAMAAVS